MAADKLKTFHMVLQAKERKTIVDALQKIYLDKIFTGIDGWREIWFYQDGTGWQVTVNGPSYDEYPEEK